MNEYMKQKHNLLLFLAFAALLLSGCRKEELPSQTVAGEKLALSFDLPQAELPATGLPVGGLRSTGLPPTGSPQSRALQSAVPTELLADNTLLCVRAYKKVEQGGTETFVFVDKGIYKVADSGKKAVANTDADALKLTRGTYDLYFLSNHSTTTYPDVTGETATVSNGTDFLSASLKDTRIQADRDGQTELTIPMENSPFRHLCSRVKATLEIPQSQPVAPTSISGLNLSVKNLRADNTYTWLTEGFTGLGVRGADKKLQLVSGDAIGAIDLTTSTAVYDPSPDGFYVLPLDESGSLQFEVSMTVKYTNKDGVANTESKLTQTVELKKALLAGMSYNFVFTLTFYGDFLPADLTLDVQDYIPVDLTPGDVGGAD